MKMTCCFDKNKFSQYVDSIAKALHAQTECVEAILLKELGKRGFELWSSEELMNAGAVRDVFNKIGDRIVILRLKEQSIAISRQEIVVQEVYPSLSVFKMIAKALSKSLPNNIKHMQAMNALSVALYGTNYPYAPEGYEHPNVGDLPLWATGGREIYIPRKHKLVNNLHGILDVVKLADTMNAFDDHCIFYELLDKKDITIGGQKGFAGFTSDDILGSDVAGDQRECFFVWSPEADDGTVYDVEFDELCKATWSDAGCFIVPSYLGLLHIQCA